MLLPIDELQSAGLSTRPTAAQRRYIKRVTRAIKHLVPEVIDTEWNQDELTSEYLGWSRDYWDTHNGALYTVNIIASDTDLDVGVDITMVSNRLPPGEEYEFGDDRYLYESFELTMGYDSEEVIVLTHDVFGEPDEISYDHKLVDGTMASAIKVAKMALNVAMTNSYIYRELFNNYRVVYEVDKDMPLLEVRRAALKALFNNTPIKEK